MKKSYTYVCAHRKRRTGERCIQKGLILRPFSFIGIRLDYRVMVEGEEKKPTDDLTLLKTHFWLESRKLSTSKAMMRFFFSFIIHNGVAILLPLLVWDHSTNTHFPEHCSSCMCTYMTVVRRGRAKACFCTHYQRSITFFNTFCKQAMLVNGPFHLTTTYVHNLRGSEKLLPISLLMISMIKSLITYRFSIRSSKVSNTPTRTLRHTLFRYRRHIFLEWQFW